MPDPHVEIDEWHRQRIARLRSPTGWLALCGRWEIGDEPVELPIGVARADGGGVRIDVRDGVIVHHGGKPVTTARAVPGDTLTEGPRTWEVASVGGVCIVRVRDPDSEGIQRFVGIDRFPIDLGWRIPARVIPVDEPGGLTYASGKVVERRTVRLAFVHDGVDYALTATFDRPDQLFVLFADATNGVETYGAGRFVYVEHGGGDVVTLDLNQAFNPPCALTDFATCPIVPVENRMPVRVEAGEKVATFREA